jgi:hypothetical protein
MKAWYFYGAIQLKRTMYGLKQAALVFWKEFLKAFKNLGFRRSSADPCLYVKNTENGLVFWIMWVDDYLKIALLCDYWLFRKKRINFIGQSQMRFKLSENCH